jgi:hypothetical protein
MEENEMDGNVERMGQIGNAWTIQSFSCKTCKIEGHCLDLSVDGTIIIHFNVSQINWRVGVGILTILQAGRHRNRGSIAAGARYLSPFRTVQAGPPDPFPGKSWTEREADHWPPSSVEVKNAWTNIFTSPLRHHGVELNWARGQLYRHLR